TLQNAADSAALAGAGELDQEVYYASGGSRVVLDPDAARSKARAWLARRGLDVAADIDADAFGVRVIVKGRLSTTFLGLVGIGRVPVAAEATAEPVGAPELTDR
ncbi:MAG: hypothetical protein ACRDJI_03630, partial [Actinomycetota bacterium]